MQVKPLKVTQFAQKYYDLHVTNLIYIINKAR